MNAVMFSTELNNSGVITRVLP